jgi:hypothetical protein
VDSPSVRRDRLSSLWDSRPRPVAMDDYEMNDLSYVVQLRPSKEIFWKGYSVYEAFQMLAFARLRRHDAILIDNATGKRIDKKVRRKL